MLMAGGISIDRLFDRQSEHCPCDKGIYITEVKRPFHSKKRINSEFYCPFLFFTLGISNAAMPEYDEDGVLIENMFYDDN